MSTTTNKWNKKWQTFILQTFQELSNLSSSSFWGKTLWNQKLLRNSSAFLLHTKKIFSNFELFSIFSQSLLELIFATKIKTILLKQSAVLFTSVYYVSEHLQYCTQINEYWLHNFNWKFFFFWELKRSSSVKNLHGHLYSWQNDYYSVRQIPIFSENI